MIYVPGRRHEQITTLCGGRSEKITRFCGGSRIVGSAPMCWKPCRLVQELGSRNRSYSGPPRGTRAIRFVPAAGVCSSSILQIHPLLRALLTGSQQRRIDDTGIRRPELNSDTIKGGSRVKIRSQFFASQKSHRRVANLGHRFCFDALVPTPLINAPITPA